MKLNITLMKSPIACQPKQKATVQALGLRKVGQTVCQPDNAAIRGQEEVNILFRSKEQVQKRLQELEEKKSGMKEISRQIKDGERAEKVLVKEEQYKRTSLEAKRLQETVGQTKSWMEEQTAVSAEKEKELQQLEEELQEKEPVFQKQILRQ